MEDQVRSMNERGMTVVLIGENRKEMVGNICMGAYQLIYQSPKALLTDERSVTASSVH